MVKLLVLLFCISNTVIGNESLSSIWVKLGMAKDNLRNVELTLYREVAKIPTHSLLVVSKKFKPCDIWLDLNHNEIFEENEHYTFSSIKKPIENCILNGKISIWKDKDQISLGILNSEEEHWNRELKVDTSNPKVVDLMSEFNENKK